MDQRLQDAIETATLAFKDELIDALGIETGSALEELVIWQGAGYRVRLDNGASFDLTITNIEGLEDAAATPPDLERIFDIGTPVDYDERNGAKTVTLNTGQTIEVSDDEYDMVRQWLGERWTTV